MTQNTVRPVTQHEVVQIDLSHEGHGELLARAYDEVFIPSFPNPDDRDPLSKWFNRLENNTPQARHKYFVYVTGEGMDNLADARLTGISVGKYYNEIDCSLLAYNAVAESARGTGLGKLMVSLRTNAFYEYAAQQGKSLKAIFLEVCDPDLVPKDKTSIDPTLRQNMFKKWGGHVVPFSYISMTDKLSGHDLENLMFYPLKDGRVPTYKDVKDFLDQVYATNPMSKEHVTTLASLMNLARAHGHPVRDISNFPDVPVLHSGSNADEFNRVSGIMAKTDEARLAPLPSAAAMDEPRARVASGGRGRGRRVLDAGSFGHPAVA